MAAPGGAGGPPPGTLAAAVQMKAVLGTSPNVVPGAGVDFVDDTDVHFVAGRTLVRFDLEARIQRLLHASVDAQAITAVAVAPNKKYAAFAELLASGASAVHVFDWATRRKRRTFTASSLHGTSPVSHLAFTCDSKGLVVQCGSPDWNLHVFSIEKGKLLAFSHAVCLPSRSIAWVDCCPTDPTLIAVSGKGVMRLLKMQPVDGEPMRPAPLNLRRDPGVFTCHAWLSGDRLLAGAANGEVWYFEGGEFKRSWEVGTPDGPGATDPAAALSHIPRAGVYSLAVFSKGFLVGCEGGLLRVYERSEDPRLLYRNTRAFAAAENESSRIVGLAVSPNEEDLVATCASGQAYALKLSSMELFKPGEYVMKPLVADFHTAVRKSGGLVSRPTQGGHRGSVVAATMEVEEEGGAGGAASGRGKGGPAGGITAISTCVRKPIFATAGSDKTIRLWSYAASVTGDAGGGGGGAGARDPSSFVFDVTPALELVQRFPEAASSLALHPTGLMAVVGFESSLHLMAVQLGALKTFKELPVRACPEVAFSHGGHMFAAANGSTVQVFATYTCASIVTLRVGLERVVSLAWSRDDRFLVSVTKDGTVARHQVAVPNAVSMAAQQAALQAAAAAAGGGGGAGAVAGVRTGGVGGPPGAGGGGAGGGLSVLGAGPGVAGPAPGSLPASKPLNVVEIKDLAVTSISLASDNGREVFVAGTITRGGQVTSVLRHLDLSTPRAAVKGDMPLDGAVNASILYLPGLKALVAGLGTSVDRAVLGASLLPDAAGARLQEKPAGAAAGPGSGPSIVNIGDAGTAASPRKGGAAAGGAAAVPAPAPAAATAAGAAPAAGAPAAPASYMDMKGFVRAYKLPLPGPTAAGALAPPPAAGGAPGSSSPSFASEYHDIPAHAAAVTRMATACEGRLVVTGAEDGSIGVFFIADTGKAGPGKGGAAASSAAAAAGASEERLGWAEEVLIDKAELDKISDEKRELCGRIADVAQTARYNERYREASNATKLQEVEARFADEIAAAASRKASLETELEEMRVRFEDQLERMQGTHAGELRELESTYAGKISAEIDRYDALLRDRDALNAAGEEACAALAARHRAEVDDARTRYDDALREEQDAVGVLENRKRALQDEFSKLADEIEADVDAEIEDMRARFETRLLAEGRNTLLLRGENGFMKRKFVTMNKEIADQKEELAGLADKEKELHEAILSMQKDVAGHKKEIREREETLADKEARIYDLKKKNQELEKFKFVLNYKIQELKRQIMPKKREIADMREQMREMEMELLQYHRSNAALDLSISELKLKRDGVQREVDTLAASIAVRHEELVKIARDVAAVYSVAGDGRALRGAVLKLYNKYVHKEALNLAVAIAAMGIPPPAPGEVPPGVGLLRALGLKSNWVAPEEAAAARKARAGGEDDERDSVAGGGEGGGGGGAAAGGTHGVAGGRRGSLTAAAAAPAGAPSSPSKAAAGGGSSLTAAILKGQGDIPPGIDIATLEEELGRQRRYLERSVEQLKRRTEREGFAAKLEEARLLRENTSLTQEINQLRRDVKFLLAQLANVQLGGAASGATSTQASMLLEGGGAASSGPSFLDAAGTAGGPGGPSAGGSTASLQQHGDALEGFMAAAGTGAAAGASSRSRSRGAAAAKSGPPPSAAAVAAAAAGTRTRRTAALFGVV